MYLKNQTLISFLFQKIKLSYNSVIDFMNQVLLINMFDNNSLVL